MKKEFKKNEYIEYSILDYECPYLPNRNARMYYRFIPKATKKYASSLIERGYRRFGYSYFHPVCNGCDECKSLRIDVKNFKLSKSQKRVIKKNKDTKIIITKPTITFDHVNLYNKFHKFKSQKSGWNYTEIDLQTYYEEFVVGAHDFGKEILYFKDDKLIGVDLIDILDNGISAIYFFYDPDFEKLSLGIYSLLVEIDIAKKLNLDWIYLGYWVKGCKSFAYKTAFKPYELLDGFYDIYQEPNWKKIS